MMLLFVYGNILKANPINLADDFVIYFAPIVNYIGEKQNYTALSQKNFMSCLSDRTKGEKPRFLNERAVHLRNL